MEFSRPEYWCGSPFLSPGDLPNPAIELRSPALQEDSLPAEPQEKPLKVKENSSDSKEEGSCRKLEKAKKKKPVFLLEIPKDAGLKSILTFFFNRAVKIIPISGF